jgi:hypothetical protein
MLLRFPKEIADTAYIVDVGKQYVDLLPGKIRLALRPTHNIFRTHEPVPQTEIGMTMIQHTNK